MNDQIRISPIRLIGAEGEQHGIVPTAQAQEMAREAGMDLVEVSATERPPVCKILDYGKFKYSQSKKTHQKTHQQKLKEIRVRPKTGDHDVQTRIHQAMEFLAHNDKVQVNVLFRGREMQHIEEGKRVMDQVLEALAEHCKVESPSRMEGKRMVALLAPKGPPPKAPSQKKVGGPPKVRSTGLGLDKIKEKQAAAEKVAAANPPAADATAATAAPDKPAAPVGVPPPAPAARPPAPAGVRAKAP